MWISAREGFPLDLGLLRSTDTIGELMATILRFQPEERDFICPKCGSWQFYNENPATTDIAELCAEDGLLCYDCDYAMTGLEFVTYLWTRKLEKDMTGYEWVTTEMFTNKLEELVHQYVLREWVTIPGLYEILSEYYYNEVLAELKSEKEEEESDDVDIETRKDQIRGKIEILKDKLAALEEEGD